MKLDLLTSLYVFMLAAFIGFEVIRRVSPLLHTPLMSLTNALDAIAVVGAILLAGEFPRTAACSPRILGTIAIVAATSNIVGGFLITDRMLRMFKAQRAEETMSNFPGIDNLIEVTYLIATALFILSLKWLSSPRPPGAASLPANSACCSLSPALCSTTASSNTSGSSSLSCSGTIIGVPLGEVAMTAVPQRTALSHAFGALCVTLVGTAEFYLARSAPPALHHGRALHGSHSRLAHLYRQPHGRRKTTGDPAAAAHHL